MSTKTIFRWLCLLVLLAFSSAQLAACASPATPGQPELPTEPQKPAPTTGATQPVPTEPPQPTQAPASGTAGKVLMSDLSRNQSPQVDSADLQTLVQGNSTFALNFYQNLRQQGGNLFYSPLSISLALAMTYAGARGQTADQMAQTLHFLLSQDRLHPAFNYLDLQLTSAVEAASDQPQPFQLHIANSLWGEQTYTFLPEFLDIIALNYGAGLRLMDFIGAPDASRGLINDWAAEATRQKIQNLIPEGGLTSDTRLVLANAIYFKADWSYQFSPNSTQELPFTLLDGKQVSTPMMRYMQPAVLKHMVGEGFQAVELPYFGERASMLVLLPDTDQFAGFEAGLTSEKLSEILAALQPRTVALTFPKFSYEQAFSLADALRSMGMTAAFDPGLADFSGMDGRGELYISNVFHKAFVAVDEKGTEAAAATAVDMAATSIMIEDVNLVVDRPFIFLILDQTTGSILFVGRVLDPS